MKSFLRLRSCPTCGKLWEEPVTHADRAVSCPECGATCEGPYIGVLGIYDVISRENSRWNKAAGCNELLDHERGGFVLLRRREDDKCFYWECSSAGDRWRAYPAAKNWARVSDQEVEL